GELQDADGLADALAAHERRDHGDLPRSHAQEPEVCSRFHVVLYFAGGAAAGAPGLATFFSAEWPTKVRVGLNSPSLWPTMFSVTYTGMNLRPLCTAKVWPTNSGMIVLARLQVFTT